MTAQELIDQAKIEVNQPASEGALTDAQWLTLFNEGYIDFCRHTEILEKSSTAVVSALLSLYTLPTDFLESREFRWSYNRQLYPRDERKLDYDGSGWMFEVGTPESLAYYNYNAIRLKPVPSAAGTITYRYTYVPTAITLTDTPAVVDMFQHAMKDYMVAMAQLIFRQIPEGIERYKTYLATRAKAKEQSMAYQKSPDILFSQRPVTSFNYQFWDARYRAYGK